VFLTHAGMNSVMESLYHGVPLVAVPQIPEQRAVAARAAELGLGVMLDAPTPDDLRAAVAAATAHRPAVEALGAVLRATPGAPVAADALEKLLSD
jgi:UDP:flavonoid glycosyltransferase YjiC (YdhE family)